MKLTKEERELLEDVFDQLECKFWACEGPTLRPKHMITCECCHLKAKLAKKLGFYIPVKDRDWTGDDWTAEQFKRRHREACAHFGYVNTV